MNECGNCGHVFVAHGDRAVVPCDGEMPVPVATYSSLGLANMRPSVCDCSGWTPKDK